MTAHQLIPSQLRCDVSAAMNSITTHAFNHTLHISFGALKWIPSARSDSPVECSLSRLSTIVLLPTNLTTLTLLSCVSMHLCHLLIDLYIHAWLGLHIGKYNPRLWTFLHCSQVVTRKCLYNENAVRVHAYKAIRRTTILTNAPGMF